MDGCWHSSFCASGAYFICAEKCTEGKIDFFKRKRPRKLREKSGPSFVVCGRVGSLVLTEHALVDLDLVTQVRYHDLVAVPALHRVITDSLAHRDAMARISERRSDRFGDEALAAGEHAHRVGSHGEPSEHGDAGRIEVPREVDLHQRDCRRVGLERSRVEVHRPGPQGGISGGRIVVVIVVHPARLLVRKDRDLAAGARAIVTMMMLAVMMTAVVATMIAAPIVSVVTVAAAGIGEGREAQCGEEGQNENETISHRFSFLQVIRE